MTKREAEIIVGMANGDLNVVKTAKMMSQHRNTLLYYINKIKAETGTDPKKFHDMCRLLPLAEEILQREPGEDSDFELVTRCKDCEFWLKDYGEVCSREEDWFYISPDDFCSRAVMRK